MYPRSCQVASVDGVYHVQILLLIHILYTPDPRMVVHMHDGKLFERISVGPLRVRIVLVLDPDFLHHVERAAAVQEQFAQLHCSLAALDPLHQLLEFPLCLELSCGCSVDAPVFSAC